MFINFKICRAATVAQAIAQIQEQSRSRQTLLQKSAGQFQWLDILGQQTRAIDPTQGFYQELPLLQEVKRETLPQAHPGESSDKEKHGQEEHRPPDEAIMRWEEALRYETVSYRRLDFQEAWARHRRFIVLGPPGSGKSTLCQFLAWQVATGKLTRPGQRLLPALVRLRT